MFLRSGLASRPAFHGAASTSSFRSTSNIILIRSFLCKNRTILSMEPSTLSSNWKKLQETLYSQNNHSTILSKRPAPLPAPHLGSKRRKTSKPTASAITTSTSAAASASAATITTTSRPKMGTAISTISALHSSRPARSHPNPEPSTTIPAKTTTTNITTPTITTTTPTITTSTTTTATTTTTTTTTPPLPNSGLTPNQSAGKYLALDCEMVGVGPPPHSRSALARVSIVDYNGHQLYDSFVLPKEPITDYRTFVSGITPTLLRQARSLESVQAAVAALLDGRILIGHAVRHDLDALMLGHPKRDIRDTSRYGPFRALAKGRTPGLKRLAAEVLGVRIQEGEHSSVEDARATMALFRRERAGFEREHLRVWGGRAREGGKVDGDGAGNGNGNGDGDQGKKERRKKKKEKGKGKGKGKK